MVLRSAERIGEILVRPRGAIERILSTDRGGVADLALLLALRTIATELPRLVKAGFAVSAIGFDGLLRSLLRAIFSATPDVAAVLIASLLFGLLSGHRSDRPTRPRELDLAAAAWIPYLTISVAAGLATVLLGNRPDRAIEVTIEALGLAWSGTVWVLALLAVRRANRSTTVVSPSVLPEPDRFARATGLLVLAAWLALLVANGAWIIRHRQLLRPLSRGAEAPHFVLPLRGGGQFSLPTGRVTVLDFWASWCGPCRDEMPIVHKLAERYRDRVDFVAVNIEDSDAAAAISEFLRESGVDLPIAMNGGQVAGRYGVETLPTLVIVDGAGRIQKIMMGKRSEDQLARAIDGAIAGNGVTAVPPR